ncbi:diphthine methyltransferase isoform X2 [Sabethes cyaneus]|nr:diphthine methyltransferase isoform X2 [Sabethes cyaneus]XP_053682986.1 diphthine methyltransferase isoform X2 [Sabethes cyaneus]XP_053682987.1 diphthine methyltransferase isoform X2 [Sabethes cyaneus]XP_053682988.1 diphthine methyltransferase isoform X2 [Sabethes cyaneus]XP_053682989.1 diphthine methyltransferase isoform X2 [Sabethes cyaneus]
MASKINTLHSYDTLYSADSIEWCPHAPSQHLFVCGTYQLDKEEESSKAGRKGRLLLFSYRPDSNSFALEQSIETAAILDQKWHPSRPVLTVVNASGQAVTYNLLPTEEQLIPMDTLTIEKESEEEQLALSIDWNLQGDKALISDSKGGVTVLEFDERGLHQRDRFKAHSFEAWTCAFDRTDENILYTGGDDTLLNIYDIRCLEAPVMKNKCHDAGVTSLLSLRHRENLLATGSYDDQLRIFDRRAMKAPLSRTNLGGGVWRLKPNPHRPDWILCACMYHNFSIVSLKEDQSVVIESEYFEHSSICYGCDWSYASDGSKTDSYYFATCSFYDHKLCLAEIKSDNKES